MNKKNVIQVFEYDKLRFDNDSNFKENHFNSLVKFNEKNKNEYFTTIYQGVQFKNYVGVLQIGGLTIEILPKVDKHNNPDKTLWRNVLLTMLRVCKKIQVDKISETLLKKKYNSILEVYYDLFLQEVEQLIKKGLIKKYRRRQKNQKSLKGKLIFTKHIKENIIHKERFYCENEIYDKQHLIHQILLKGLVIIEQFLNTRLKDKLNRLLLEFENIEEIPIAKHHFDRITLNRKSKPYSKAIEIAKMLILNYSPNINSGNDNMLTLLFDMNELWEEYIYRILNKHKPNGFEIGFQKRKVFWESSLRKKRVVPDIIITNKKTQSGTDKNYVIDTKWKIRNPNEPDDDDLKQMFVYNLLWSAEKSMLLYPKTYQNESGYGDYGFKDKDIVDNSLIELNNQCKLGFISLIDENKIRNSKIVSNEIFQKLIV